MAAAAAPRRRLFDPHDDELAKFKIPTKDSVTPEEKFLDYLCMIAVSEEQYREDSSHYKFDPESQEHRARQQAFNHVAAVTARSGAGADGFLTTLKKLYGDERLFDYAFENMMAHKAAMLKAEMLEGAEDDAMSFMHVAAQLGHNHVFAILTRIPRYEVLPYDEDADSDSEDSVLEIREFYGAGVSQATREFEKSAVKKAFDMAFTLDSEDNLAAHYAIQVTGMNGTIRPDVLRGHYKSFYATDGSDGESHFGICRLMNATALVDFGFESQESLRMKVHDFMCQRNSKGETPFDLAIKSEGNNISLLRMMKRRGCDPYMGQRINVWQSAREGDDSLYVSLLDSSWLPGHYDDDSQMHHRGLSQYQYYDRLDTAIRIFLGCAVAERHDVELHKKDCRSYTPGYSRRIAPDGRFLDEPPDFFVENIVSLNQGMDEYYRPYTDAIRLVDEKDQAKALSLWALRGSRLPPEQKAEWLRGLHIDTLQSPERTIYAALLERFKEEVSADIWELMDPSASAGDSVHRAMQDVFDEVVSTSMENTGVEERLFPYRRHIEKGTEPSSDFQLRLSFVHLIL